MIGLAALFITQIAVSAAPGAALTEATARAGGFCETLMVGGALSVPTGGEVYMGLSDQPPLRPLDEAPKVLLDAFQPLGQVGIATRVKSAEGDAWAVSTLDRAFCVVTVFAGPMAAFAIDNTNKAMMSDKSWSLAQSSGDALGNPPRKGTSNTFKKRDAAGELEARIAVMHVDPSSPPESTAFVIVYQRAKAFAGAAK